MSDFSHAAAALAIDYYLAASVLLAAAVGAMALLRQPVERMAVAWGTMLGLAALALLCALPAWPRVSLVSLPEEPAAQVATGESAPSQSTVEFVPSAQDIRPTQDDARLRPEIADGPKSRSIPPMRMRRPASDDAAQPAPEVPSRPMDRKSLALGGFLLGGLAVLVWQIVGAVQLRRLCSGATAAPDFATAELRRIVGERARAPRLLVSSRINSAAACGLWRPTILLPASLIAQPPANATDQAGLAALLSHEWAHVRRGDLWLLFLSRVLLVGLYPHPLFWLLLRRVGVDRELIADTLAAEACGRKEFAACLVEWARRQSSQSRPTAALGIWQRRAELSRRISMLLDERIRLRTACSRAVRYVAGASIVAVVAALSAITLQPTPAAFATVTEEPALAVVATTEPADPAAPKSTDESAPQQKVKITGVCLDDQRRPVAGARARIYRVDAGKDYVTHPSGRIKFDQGFLPDMSSTSDGVMGQDSYSCDRNSQRMIEEVKADDAGRFEFAPLAADSAWLDQKSTLWICVQAPGKATQWDRAMVHRGSDKAFVTNPLKLTLATATTLRGRVTDDAGKPIAGATITVAMADHLPKPVPGLACATSNANGDYEIADLAPFDIDSMPPSLVTLGAFSYVSVAGRVEHPDYAPQLIEYKRLPAVADAVLSKPATLSIRVRASEKDEPLVKAYVQWTDKNGISQHANTDEHGVCVADRLGPGTYKVEATTLDRLKSVETVELKRGSNSLELKNARGGIIKGRVVDDATGKPAELSSSMSSNVGASIAGVTAEDAHGGWVNPTTGEFTMVVRPGKNLINFASFGGMYQQSWELVDAERWTKTGIEVAQDQTVEIELRVKPSKTLMTALQDGIDKWRGGLMTKDPMPEAQLRETLAQGDVADVTTETINGKEEITSITMQMGHFDIEGRILQLAPVERSLLAHVRKFPKLKALMLYHPPGGDAGLESLRGIESLETFAIVDVMSGVTATGVAHLATLPNLQTLYLLSRKVDDAAFDSIAKMPKLETLVLAGALTDKGLQQLSKKTSLTALVLGGVDGANFTDAGLAHLGRLKNLKQLGLTTALVFADEATTAIVGEAKMSEPANPWHITDDGLQPLAALADLEGLTLTGPQLTDAGLVHLRGLKKLKDLTVEDTQITPAGMEALKKFLPELKTTVKPKPADTEPAAQGAGRWPASPYPPTRGHHPHKKESPSTKLTFEVVCLDEQQQPIAGARARLFRVDEGTDRVKSIFARLKPVDVLSPASAASRDGSLIAGEYSCNVKSQRLLEEVRSDAAGRIVFAPLAVDPSWEAQRARMLVCVQVPGKATQWTNPSLNRGADKALFLEPSTVTMPPAATLRGRVTDKAGHPVAGALVAGNAREHLPQLVPGVQCSVTDAEGRYEITDLAPFDVNALESQTLVFEIGGLAGIVEHAKFAPHVIEFEKLPGTVDAVLSPPATLTAQVVADEDGKPLAKAIVRWTSQQGENQLSHTDDKGEHVFERLEPGKYTVVATVEDRLWATETVELKEGANALALRLKRGGILKGRLIDDATGKPLVLSSNIGSNVNALIVGGKPEDVTSGYVDPKTAEFSMAARPGRNQLQVAAFGNTLRSAWELVDEERWSKTGVEIAQGQTVEVELRVKPGNGIVASLNEGFAYWREALMTKEPYSEEMLRKILKHQGTATETISGREEIIAIEVGSYSGGDGEQAELMRIAPLERSLLAHIQKFPHLRTLSLFHPPGGDKSLESLRGLQHLETLEIADALDNVTSAGVKHLATLPNLETLFLVSHKLDDAALAEFARLPKLKELSCGGVFTDAGLAQLATAKSLTTLAVFSTGDGKITDAGLAHLSKLTRLQVLAIAEVTSFQEEEEDAQQPEHSAVTNDGLRHLASLTDLEALSISGSKLTDAGLVHLRGLKKLKSLSTAGTKITPAGIDELRKFLPQLKPPAKVD